MSWSYRNIVRPVLFSHESEEIHNRTITGLSFASRSPLLLEMLSYFYSGPKLPVFLWNLRFLNPVGLAAGMDKQAAAIPAWAALGFGFCELGGVTAHPQPGNPEPRMFRAIEDEAIINRMGFNNPGAERMAEQLLAWKNSNLWPQHPVGINLGKSKITPNERAAADYAASLRLLSPFADFFVVNVSSPNTPNLRQLQDKSALSEILAMAQELNSGPGRKPLLVKVAPDLTFSALDEIIEVAQAHRIDGIVATNTTLARPERSDPELRRVYSESGGLSGKPLRLRSTEIIRYLFRQTRGSLPIIGVGGIFSAEDAWEKITAGASLVQVYTGLVYEGPGLVRNILEGLSQKLNESGFTSMQDAVGIRCAP